MAKEFERTLPNLESTIRAGNISYEGISFLIGECVKASKGGVTDLAIAVAVIIRNATTSKNSCDKIHNWAIAKHGKDVVDQALDISLKKLKLEADLLLGT